MWKITYTLFELFRIQSGTGPLSEFLVKKLRKTHITNISPVISCSQYGSINIAITFSHKYYTDNNSKTLYPT